MQDLAKYTMIRWPQNKCSICKITKLFSLFHVCDVFILYNCKKKEQPSFVFRSFSLLLSDSSVSAAVKPLPCSAGHINPAGLWLYGSPAHTSVMRVNKQRAKGQQSPQNKEGRRGEARGEKRAGPRQCSDHCQGFKQAMMYETTAQDRKWL